jgi:DNA-binding response OmpR family regulator
MDYLAECDIKNNVERYNLVMPKKILVIDDEQQIVEICSDYLKSAGYQVISTNNSQAGIDLTRREQPDLVVLDIMMPELDGFDVCKAIRRQGNIPIIMLTARVDEMDKLIGLELGADDYMTKPFSPRELVARVKTVLRRVGSEPGSDLIRVENIELDRNHFEIKVKERVIPLTPTEFEIAALLMSQPGRIFSRAQLLVAVHGVAFESYERAIDSHIRNLRHKLEPDDLIMTVHGVGYRFQV